MLVPLEEAAADTCGGKAGALGALLRAGLPVPDGFVVPFAVYRAAVGDLDLAQVVAETGGAGAARALVEHHPVHRAVIDALERALSALGERPVAVRSSAANEDSRNASAAGQHESILAVHGLTDVADAVRDCWASLFSSRAAAYRTRSGGEECRGGELAMAVLVQHHLDAEISGVMFTPASPDGATVIEASWGLGPHIVGGVVTPDAYRVDASGTATTSVADKQTRLDRNGTRLVSREVPAERRGRPTLDDTTATELAVLGSKVADVLGGAQDIEWVIADGHTWVVQARPVTATPPHAVPSPGSHRTAATLTGTPGSHETATGTARSVRGPRDFARVRPGEILICRFTDPAWTPLLRIAGGVITEVGGVLSHAAIVAREHGIPGARHPERDEPTRRRFSRHRRRQRRHRNSHRHVSSTFRGWIERSGTRAHRPPCPTWTMATRHLYVARHGAADALGELTKTGYQQAALLGERLASVPVDVVWHSPLPRAVASAHEIAQQLPDVPLIEAPELIDHVPFVPSAAETPSAWAGFFDGYGDAEAAAGQRVAETLVARFGTIPEETTSWSPSDTHEVLVTHSYPIAWLVRHALDAPPLRWLGLNSANAALTVIECRNGLPPTIVMFNEMSHLPTELRWTGFPDILRP